MPDSHARGDLVEKLRHRLAGEPDVLAAYLFGSWARGTSGPLSDVDVAVLLADGAPAARRLDLTNAVAAAVASERADVVILNDSPVALAYRVLVDGLLLLSADESARCHHWARTVDRYLDMAPLRRTLDDGLRHRLEEGALADAEVVRRRLRQIDRRLGLLRQIQERGRQAYVDDDGVQAQAERHLQIAIQAAVDIALHVLAEDRSTTPESYGSAFTLVAPVVGLPDELTGRLRQVAGLRNVLVHTYLDVDPERIWEHLSRLDDLQVFAASIERYLASR